MEAESRAGRCVIGHRAVLQPWVLVEVVCQSLRCQTDSAGVSISVRFRAGRPGRAAGRNHRCTNAPMPLPVTNQSAAGFPLLLSTVFDSGWRPPASAPRTFSPPLPGTPSAARRKSIVAAPDSARAFLDGLEHDHDYSFLSPKVQLAALSVPYLVYASPRGYLAPVTAGSVTSGPLSQSNDVLLPTFPLERFISGHPARPISSSVSSPAPQSAIDLDYQPIDQALTNPGIRDKLAQFGHTPQQVRFISCFSFLLSSCCL